MTTQDRDSYEQRIKTLKDASGLGAELVMMRHERDTLQLQLAQANAELLRRGSTLDVLV